MSNTINSYDSHRLPLDGRGSVARTPEGSGVRSSQAPLHSSPPRELASYIWSTKVCTCIYIYIYIYTYTSIYIYICIFTYIYIYIEREREMYVICVYIYIYIYLLFRRSFIRIHRSSPECHQNFTGISPENYIIYYTLNNYIYILYNLIYIYIYTYIL